MEDSGPSPAPRTMRYGDAPSQFGELYLPAATRPPVVCLLHGGFWRVRYGSDLMVPLARDLVSRGYAVWNVEYRRLGEAGGGWPGTLLDVAAAIDHLATIAHDHALDLDRVVAVGHSAGGHLALWAAGRSRASGGFAPAPRVRVAAAVGQAAVADLEEAHARRLSRGVVAELMGGPPNEQAQRYAIASPIALLPFGVPQLLLHGTADEDVPVELSRRFARAAVAAGDACELVALPSTGHMEFLDPASTAHETLCRWLESATRPPRIQGA